MREQDPVFYDALFRQKRKGGKWRVMPSPVLEGPVADTHAHLQMLADPACELARAGAHGVAFVETIVDPAEDGFATFDDLPLWLMEAARDLKVMEEEDDGAAGIVAAPAVPHVRIAAGVHPHNAKDWTPELKAALRERLRDRRVSAVGEIGLDYHYDLSPHDVQQDVFRAQIRLAKEAGLPIALHMREAAALVPADRLLTETDSPYMTPEPVRGTDCGPAHTIYTANVLCEVRGADTPEARAALLAQLYENAQHLLNRKPTCWQRIGA